MLKSKDITLINKSTLKSESTNLQLDAKHPGLHDSAYVARRQWFFDISRSHRIQDQELPEINYHDHEHEVWRCVSTKLAEQQARYASDIYLRGKQQLNFSTDRIPNLNQLSQQLYQQQGIRLIAAEGLIDTRNFFAYLSNKIMPCTQFLRHHSNPEYTPEPDVVHDVIGHVPPLMDPEYVELIQLVGHGVKQASDEELLIWERLYWFTVEFGLIKEGTQLKAFGAGLLSSFGELEYCFSDNVERRPFILQDVINMDYDPTQMQHVVFIVPSLRSLINDIKQLIG